MAKDYKPTTLGYAILGLLHGQAMSGYRVRKVFEMTPMGHYSSSPGSIYPALRRLQQEGLIQQVVDRRSEKPKKLFGITRSGIDHLRRWVLLPVSTEDVAFRDNELLLRFAFMDGLVEQAEVAQFLQSFHAGLMIHIAGLEHYREEAPENITVHGLLALENGIAVYKAHAQWVEHALTQLGEND